LMTCFSTCSQHAPHPNCGSIPEIKYVIQYLHDTLLSHNNQVVNQPTVVYHT
jgi:hypothetical protein